MAEKQNIAKEALKKSNEAKKKQDEITFLTKNNKPAGVILNRLDEAREITLQAIENEKTTMKLLDKDSKYKKKHQNNIDENNAFLEATDIFYE